VPPPSENGIECTTGSLGHGLPVAVGMALAKKMKKEYRDEYYPHVANFNQ
jgi:transketolase N-terminal domain/subunit